MPDKGNMQVQVVVLQTKGDTKQSKVEITGEIEDEIPTRIAKSSVRQSSQVRLAHGVIKRVHWNSGATKKVVLEQKISMSFRHPLILHSFSATLS